MLRAILLLLTALTCAAPAVAQVQITEIPILSSNAGPLGIVPGPDGAMWFTENSSNKIGRILLTSTPANPQISEFAVGSAPSGITFGPDGALWFSETSANRIGRITTAGVFTDYPIANPNGASPVGITTGPGGLLYFAELGGQVGQITTGGTVNWQVKAVTGNTSTGITATGDGRVWFGEFHTGIGVTNQLGSPVNEYKITNGGANYMTVGPDGNVWFTDPVNNAIGLITSSYAITEFPIPTSAAYPNYITVGPDGALWFAESDANKIGRITTAGAITEYPTPTPGSHPVGITSGPDGAVWFTEQNANQIGRIPVSQSKILIWDVTISTTSGAYTHTAVVVNSLDGTASGTTWAGDSFTFLIDGTSFSANVNVLSPCAATVTGSGSIQTINGVQQQATANLTGSNNNCSWSGTFTAVGHDSTGDDNVTAVSGNSASWVIHNNVKLPLLPGTVLSDGDLIHTDNSGGVYVTLWDGELILVGANSEYQLQEPSAPGAVLHWLLRGAITLIVDTSCSAKEPDLSLSTYPARTIG